jgi:hypothetical protein
MDLKSRPILIILTLLVMTSLSCGLVSDWMGRAASARDTARDVIDQAQSLATQSQMVRGTAQAFTEQNPSLAATAQAFLTEEGPGLLETARVMATQQPGLLETAQAVLAQGASGERPQGIPIPDGANTLYSSAEAISYTTPLGFQQVLHFYNQEMEKEGWMPVAEGSFQAGEAAVLNYTQGERRASVMINYNADDGKTVVLVTAQ